MNRALAISLLALALSVTALIVNVGGYKISEPPEWSDYDRNVEYREFIEGIILLSFSFSDSPEYFDMPIFPELAKNLSDYVVILDRENQDLKVVVEAASSLRDLQPLRQYILERRSSKN